MADVIANTADELFDGTLELLLALPVNGQPGISHELINANLVLKDPTRNTMCECKRKMSMRYAIGELLWYNSRNDSSAAIRPFSTYWDKIADFGNKVNSNYGEKIHDYYDFDQWIYVKQLLTQYPNSRQAVMHIKPPIDTFTYASKDVPCTLTLQFLLRNNELDLIVNMRSNDVWLGLPYDVFNFTCMQMQMAMELHVGIGVYYHNAGSLHLYHKDYLKLKEADNGI